MKIILCIFQKLLSVLLMLVALAIPFSIFINEWQWILVIPGIILSLISYSLIKLSHKMLLTTNNPADRNNFFSINKRYSSKMNGSFGENGINSIILQSPTIQEELIVKQKLRKNKLKAFGK